MLFRTAASPLAIMLLVTTGGAVSAEQPAPKIDCENATSTVELNYCADAEFEKADAELNAAYKKALAAVPEMAAEPPFDTKSWETALRASQRAWVAYRDAECDGHVPMFWTGGTGTTAEVIGCKSELTKQRTERLKDHYEAR